MDKNIKKILNEIEKNGFEAYVVGGYVRDYLLGINSTDIDICTNALPKNLMEIFNSNNMSNSEYGSFKIQTDKYTFDITTYRQEQKYINRHPTEITYINNLLTDLERRDFTINTMCMNQNGDIIDPLKGCQDLQKRIIKSVGNIKAKLQEDPLRILRAVRFSITLNFKLDQQLKKEIIKNKELINTLSYSRKRAELDRILVSPYVKEGIELLKKLGIYELLEIDISEITPVKDVCAMYSQIKYSERYPFTKSEKFMINSIREILKEEQITPHTIFKHGLYINTLAGKILGYEPKEVNEIYDFMPIKSLKDLAITPIEIINYLAIKPSKMLKRIQNELVYHILEGNLINNKASIYEYLKLHKGRWQYD